MALNAQLKSFQLKQQIASNNNNSMKYTPACLRQEFSWIGIAIGYFWLCILAPRTKYKVKKKVEQKFESSIGWFWFGVLIGRLTTALCWPPRSLKFYKYRFAWFSICFCFAESHVCTRIETPFAKKLYTVRVLSKHIDVENCNRLVAAFAPLRLFFFPSKCILMILCICRNFQLKKWGTSLHLRNIIRNFLRTVTQLSDLQCACCILFFVSFKEIGCMCVNSSLHLCVCEWVRGMCRMSKIWPNE